MQKRLSYLLALLIIGSAAYGMEDMARIVGEETELKDKKLQEKVEEYVSPLIENCHGIDKLEKIISLASTQMPLENNNTKGNGAIELPDNKDEPRMMRVSIDYTIKNGRLNPTGFAAQVKRASACPNSLEDLPIGYGIENQKLYVEMPAEWYHKILTADKVAQEERKKQ